VSIVQDVINTVLGIVNDFLDTEITLDIADLLGLSCEVAE
jgi:hypothetical protein